MLQHKPSRAKRILERWHRLRNSWKRLMLDRGERAAQYQQGVRVISAMRSRLTAAIGRNPSSLPGVQEAWRQAIQFHYQTWDATALTQFRDDLVSWLKYSYDSEKFLFFKTLADAAALEQLAKYHQETRSHHDLLTKQDLLKIPRATLVEWIRELVRDQYFHPGDVLPGGDWDGWDDESRPRQRASCRKILLPLLKQRQRVPDQS